MKNRITLYRMTAAALLMALVFVLGMTPLGLIPLGFINVTILCVPVITGALVLGARGNVRAVQADMVYKRGRPFDNQATRTGSADPATARAARAARVGPWQLLPRLQR